MALTATFLGGAKGRLLAASIPFRFFITAALFQALAWMVLLWAAPTVPRFSGGLGWPLAALHLVTLGVLVMTAVGASLQLLPVATRQGVGASRWPLDLVWGLLTLGVLALTCGMAIVLPTLLLGGASAIVLALLLYLFLLVRNLQGAKGMPVVVAHGWAACVSLLVVLVSGLSLASAYSGASPMDRSTAVGLHVTFAGYGFMGMLVMGFSYILVPMFALSANPPPRESMWSFALAVMALLLAFGSPLLPWPIHLLGSAAVLGALALAIHVALMRQALRTGMRQGLGPSFVLVRLGWAALLASLGTVLAQALGALPESGPTLFGVLLIGGLLTLLLGMLSRIIPFLASMHAGALMRRAPTPSSLTAQRPLDIHFYCHLAALALLLSAIALDSVWLVRASALLGCVGAFAFAMFCVTAWRRMTRAAPKAAPLTPANA